MSVEERLHELGIELPEPPPPAGNYIGAVSVGNLLFLSGHGPRGASGEYSSGKLGSDLTLEQGQKEARKVGINMLATLKAEIGDLDRVRRVVKVLGMVNAVPDFRDHPSVINGFSDFMVEVFGEKGRGARSAVGMGSLPFQIPVEVEMIVEIDWHSLMIPDLDVYRSANLLVKQHGEDVPIHTAMWAGKLLEAGQISLL